MRDIFGWFLGLSLAVVFAFGFDFDLAFFFFWGGMLKSPVLAGVFLNKICGWNASFNIYGDCKSALSLASSEGGTWRTRHLRLRAAKLRDVLEAEPWVERCHDTPKWNLRHMPGQYLVADGLTKRFQGQGFRSWWMPLSLSMLRKRPRSWKLIQVTPSNEKLKDEKWWSKLRVLGTLLGQLSEQRAKSRGALILAVVALRRRQRKKSLCQEFVPWEDQGMMHLGRHALRPPHDVARDQARHL